MRRLYSIFIFLLMAGISSAQQPAFRLHVQGSKAELTGDGDDYTTIVVTARDAEGEIIPTVNGKVMLRCSAGFLDESELQMVNGIAFTKYTAPIFGQPIKAAQRMVYFVVKFIRKFLSRFNGSTDMDSNQKLAGKIALETFKEGINPLTLIPKKDGANFTYFVSEMNGVKGKTKIEIKKATEGGNSSIVPGYYSGYDVTGSAPFELVIESGGKGQMTQNGIDPVGILFTSEKSAEINSAMQKMMGGGEWMNVYMGASERDMQYMEGYDIRKNGLPSIYLPMPNNGIFTYIPPILFEYQGRPKETSTAGNTNSAMQEEQQSKERVFVTIEQNELIGDGRTQTKAIFHYEDVNKVPVAGKNIKWEIPGEFKVISQQTVTDGSGNAVAVIQMPVLKATGEKRGDMWKQIIDNTSLFRIMVNFSTPKRQNESVYTDFSVYKTIEKNIRILKAGFETKPVKVLLPQLEDYTFESNIFAYIEMINSPSVPEKMDVNDVVVMVERKDFDEESFNKKFEYYFKKDRKFFITNMNSKGGGFIAITDAAGKFKLNVGNQGGRKIKVEPLEVKLSDLTGRRKGELGKTLSLFEDPEFVNKVIDGFYKIDKDLCLLNSDKAVMVEEKLHLIGMLMVNANTGDKLMKDTDDELIAQGWELMKTTAEYANKKWEITDKMYKKLKLDKVSDKLGEYGKKVKEKTGLDNIDKICDSLGKLGLHYENSFWKSALGKDDYKYGTKKIIQYFFAETVLPEGAKNSDKAKASATYYKLLGDLGGEVAGKIWEQLSEAISEALSTYVVPTRVKNTYEKGSKYVEETQKAVTDYVPDKIKGAIQSAYYSSMKADIIKFFGQPYESVHQVYPNLQPALRDRSTELRAYYGSIAAWRYNAEMLKAYIDLGIDLVVKSIVLIVDAYSGNWTDIPKHFKKLDEGKAAIGTAFTAGGFAMELYRLNNLWAEVISSFVYANKCISQGNMSTTATVTRGSYLFASAYAAVPGKIAPVGLSVPGEGQLKYSGSGLPLEGLNAVFANSAKLESWMEENMPAINRLAFTKPEAAAALFESVSKYRENSEQLAVLSIAVAADPKNAGLAAEFNKTASKTANNGKLLKETTGDAVKALNELPGDPKVNIVPGEKSVLDGSNKTMLIYIGAGFGGLVVVIVLIIVVHRRRRKSYATPARSNTPLPLPYSPTSQVVSSPLAPSPPPHPPSTIPHPPSPKFCPQCGAPFVAGKKFCGKCGYKIPS